jgi:hypothetical protein
VPPHKRLRGQAPGIGLPIGNLTSQWFANAYLAPLDGFVQRQLGLGAYVRYMDDFVVLSTDPVRLEAARQAISQFLLQRLHLQVHGKPLQRAAAGVDFCGFIVRPAYLLPRRRVVAAWRERCLAAQAPLGPTVVPQGKRVVLAGIGRICGPCAAFAIDGAALARLRDAWTSGRGATRHGACRRLQQRAARSLPLVARYLTNPHGKARLAVGDPLASQGRRLWPDWPAQRRWLLGQAPRAVLLVQFGRLYELVRYRDAKRLGLAWRGRGRGRGCGVPQSGVAALVAQALGRGFAVAVALEGPASAGAVRERTIRWWLEPLRRTALWWQQVTGSALDVNRTGRPRLPKIRKWSARS